MTDVPKSPPLRDKAHLARIRAMRCICCDAPPPSEAAHLRIGHVVGMGQKPPDDLTVPLCHEHHMKEHSMGPLLFWKTRLATDEVLMAKAMHALARSLK